MTYDTGDVNNYDKKIRFTARVLQLVTSELEFKVDILVGVYCDFLYWHRMGDEANNNRKDDNDKDDQEEPAEK